MKRGTREASHLEELTCLIIWLDLLLQVVEKDTLTNLSVSLITIRDRTWTQELWMGYRRNRSEVQTCLWDRSTCVSLITHLWLIRKPQQDRLVYTQRSNRLSSSSTSIELINALLNRLMYQLTLRLLRSLSRWRKIEGSSQTISESLLFLTLQELSKEESWCPRSLRKGE